MSGMNRQGRPTSVAGMANAGTAHGGTHDTFTGNKALELEEPLLFELDNPGICGVDLDEPEPFTSYLGNFERQGRIGLPALGTRSRAPLCAPLRQELFDRCGALSARLLHHEA